MRDERHSRIAVRYRAASPDLTVKSGFLGQSRQAGTGSDNVSMATWEVKRARSRFLAAPGGKKCGYLKKTLFVQPLTGQSCGSLRGLCCG